MDYLEYKGYKGSVEYSKEDNCLFGKVQGMSKALILYEGNTLDELRKDFEEGVDSYLEACKADGVEPVKPYSGRLNLRMSSELHSRLNSTSQSQRASSTSAKFCTTSWAISTALSLKLHTRQSTIHQHTSVSTSA